MKVKVYHIGEQMVDRWPLPRDPIRITYEEEEKMTKYFIETKNEDFVIDVPADAQVVTDTIYGNNDSPVGELRVVRREIVKNTGPDWANVQYNDHVLARWEGVVACRSEEVSRVDPEVA